MKRQEKYRRFKDEPSVLEGAAQHRSTARPGRIIANHVLANQIMAGAEMSLTKVNGKSDRNMLHRRAVDSAEAWDAVTSLSKTPKAGILTEIAIGDCQHMAFWEM